MKGNWESMNMLTSPRGGESSVMLGGAVHYQLADSAVTGLADLGLFLATVDLTAHFGGTTLFAALMYANAHQSPGGTSDNVGLVVQAGHYLAESWELFGRIEWADIETLSDDELIVLTFGFNKYLGEFNAKWTTDFGVAFDTVPASAPITGWRADLPGEDTQVVVRSQFQIMF
jgi:hypothetical protein